MIAPVQLAAGKHTRASAFANPGFDVFVTLYVEVEVGMGLVHCTLDSVPTRPTAFEPSYWAAKEWWAKAAMGGSAAALRRQGPNGVYTLRPAGPTLRLASGKPDLNGFWRNKPGTKPVGNTGKDLPGFKLPLRKAGQVALEYNLTKSIDPGSLCLPGGIPLHSASGLPFVILQTLKDVAFLHFYNYFRLVPTDGTKHPTDRDPAFFGHQIGWWEGDTLVIDAIAFKGEQVWIDENANPHSDQLHVVERWTRTDTSTLEHESPIEEPKYYMWPFK